MRILCGPVYQSLFVLVWYSVSVTVQHYNPSTFKVITSCGTAASNSGVKICQGRMKEDYLVWSIGVSICNE